MNLDDVNKERAFPVLNYKEYEDCPRFVKWSALNEEWAMRNHSQTLKTLAGRWGLCPEEIVCNVNKHGWWDKKVSKKSAIDLVKKIAFEASHDR